MTAPEPRRVRRSRTPLWVGAASVVLVGALVGGLLWSGDDPGGPLGAGGTRGSEEQGETGETGAEGEGAGSAPTVVESDSAISSREQSKTSLSTIAARS